MKKIIASVFVALFATACAKDIPGVDVVSVPLNKAVESCKNIELVGINKTNGYRNQSNQQQYVVEYEYTIAVKDKKALEAMRDAWSKERDYYVMSERYYEDTVEITNRFAVTKDRKEAETLKKIIAEREAVLDERITKTEDFDYYNREEEKAVDFYKEGCSEDAATFADVLIEMARDEIKSEDELGKWFEPQSADVKSTTNTHKTELGWRLLAN